MSHTKIKPCLASRFGLSVLNCSGLLLLMLCTRVKWEEGNLGLCLFSISLVYSSLYFHGCVTNCTEFFFFRKGRGRGRGTWVIITYICRNLILWSFSRNTISFRHHFLKFYYWAFVLCARDLLKGKVTVQGWDVWWCGPCDTPVLFRKLVGKTDFVGENVHW